jgi:hypothetical protein
VGYFGLWVYCCLIVYRGEVWRFGFLCGWWFLGLGFGVGGVLVFGGFGWVGGVFGSCWIGVGLWFLLGLAFEVCRAGVLLYYWRGFGFVGVGVLGFRGGGGLGVLGWWGVFFGYFG